MNKQSFSLQFAEHKASSTNSTIRAGCWNRLSPRYHCSQLLKCIQLPGICHSGATFILPTMQSDMEKVHLLSFRRPKTWKTKSHFSTAFAYHDCVFSVERNIGQISSTETHRRTRPEQRLQSTDSPPKFQAVLSLLWFLAGQWFSFQDAESAYVGTARRSVIL